MNSDIINKKIAFYPDSYFTMNHYKYKRFTDKINKLKKDLEMFIDNNKKKMIKPKKKFNSLRINRLFRKLVFDSTNKVLKNYENNDKKTNKRFFSAKEIQKYKDSKIMFLKLIRMKSMNNPKKKNNPIDRNFMNNNRSVIDNRTNFIIYSRNNLNKKDNNLSKKKHKSIYSQPSVKDILCNPKVEKNKRKINSKLKLSGDKYINRSSIQNQSNYVNIKYDKDSIKNNENEIIIKSFNDSLNNNSNNNNFWADNYDNDNYKLIKQKVNLKKLKFKVHKFENSSKYFPDSDIILKNIKQNKFINKKFIKNNKLDKSFINNREYNNIIKNKIKKRNINSAPRIIPKLNKLLISPKKENTNRTMNIMNKYNTTILYQTINDIQKKIKIKKRIIKKERNKKSSYVKKITDYFKNKHYNRRDIDKDMKRDFIEYQNKIGHFIKIDEKYLYTSHIAVILENRKNILKNNSHAKNIW